MYLDWNDKIAAYFFQPEMAGRPVYLYVTEEMLKEMGASLEESFDNFLEAVKVGPPWVTRPGLCQKAHQSFEKWRVRPGLNYPPYIAYLSLFVLAAGVDGDFAPNAYYPRLRQLIGEASGSTLPSFELMLDLWDDLERWSNQDKQGQLGIFNINIAGNLIHVGLPIAQIVLTERERKALPNIFADARIDPTTSLSDAELARKLRRYGIEHLRPKTLALLEQPAEQGGSRELLLETIQEELADWDGSVEVVEADSNSSTRATFGSLRLCASIDRTARRLRVSLRCRVVNRDFPEGGLFLKARHTLGLLSCEEEYPGWSSALVDAQTDEPANASQYDWVQGLELEDEQLGWRFRLPGGSIRVFISGAPEGFPGLVEVRQLPRSVPFCVAFKGELWPNLRSWAESSCQKFEEIEIREGLPAGWRFFSSSGASTDEGVREFFPILSFSETLRISLSRGIRSSQGSNFYAFAAPEVMLEGGSGAEKVYCDDRELEFVAETRTYKLPSRLPTDKRLLIEARRESAVLRRRSFYLVEPLDSRGSDSVRVFDRFGKSVSHPGPDTFGVAGAYVQNASVPEYRFPFFPQRFPGQRVVFLGQVPGQIFSAREEAPPRDWLPIWAIFTGHKQGYAVFCGTNVTDSIPLTSDVCEPAKVHLWKEILWHSRKRIAPPQQPTLRKLWKQYVEVARHV